MNREDLYHVTVSVTDPATGETRDLGTWDKQSGGESDSEETTYKPGGSRRQVSLGGSPTTGNVTVSRIYEKDVHDVYHWLAERAGRADMRVVRQPTDKAGNAFGRPIVWGGTLKKVAPPDYDSEGTGAALLELEMTCTGGPS